MESMTTKTGQTNTLERPRIDEIKTALQKPGDDLGLGQLTVTPDGQLVVRLETTTQPGVWETYIRPALPYAATFSAGAALGVLGAMYFLADDDEDASV